DDMALVVAQFVAQRQQPVLAATGCDHLAAGCRVAAGGSGAKAGGRAGNEGDKAAGIEQRIHGLSCGRCEAWVQGGPMPPAASTGAAWTEPIKACQCHEVLTCTQGQIVLSLPQIGILRDSLF